ncbi:MAG: hydroxymyristoyl-ACP dehydratase [Legionellales bacterium]|nr:hydroxymyristoyl-ACP dehydratase [Legionellales bacterium]
MNFLFVDQILKSIPAQEIRGIKHVTADDIYLEKTAAGNYELMSCIVGEALGQLAAWNVIAYYQFQRRPVAGVVGEVEILGQAALGDSILLESVIDSVDENVIHYHSVASVKDHAILKLHHALGPFLPAEQFIDHETLTAQYQKIYRPTESIEFISHTANPNLIPPTIFPIHFDSIVEWNKGQSVTAIKKVNGLAPYFVDHFPRKPVLPLSVLLQCQVNLARDFIANLMDEENAQTYFPSKIRRIKMKEFVQPGDQLLARMELKEQTESHCVFRFHCELHEKRVCVSEIEFQRTPSPAR